ncbi:MAG: gamma-glutamylcyclotransferase family protein [Thiolinea sp.]
MPFVFGYGSLMNPVSAEKTLHRPLCREDFHCATLHDYVRSWTAPGCIRLQEKESGRIRPCDALFLDLSYRPGQSCNGVVVEVTVAELQRLDIREQGYQRCVVELEFDDGCCLEGFTYVMPECTKQHEGIIAARYKQMIDEALQAFPADFAARFWQTTQPSAAKVVEGEYVFDDCAQNQAAGRSLSG